MPYTPHTTTETKDMLDFIGLKNENELFDCIPDNLKIKNLNLPDGLDEFTTFEKFKSLASKNITNKISFLGGGYYDHIIPSAVDALSFRSEFYTAYTPYQAEASQGTLQTLYEYQSLICRLTSMDISNASMYDGATAFAEASLMAVRITKRNKILIDSLVNPNYIKIVQTYLKFRDIKLEIINILKDNIDDFLDDDVAGYLFQNPNFFGEIKDFTNIIKKVKNNKSLAVLSAYPIALSILKEPASLGVDIVSADGQCLGNYLSFGGPSFGILACKKEYIRNLPGRIIGKTTDKNNKEIFVLTMQAREQHIRRQRATSNICSNQNLMAIRSAMFLSLLGKDGLVDMANICYEKTQYLKEQLSKIDGIKIKDKDTFNEFVIKINKNTKEFLDTLSSLGFYGGINLENLYQDRKNQILISVTEKRTKEQINKFVETIRSIV
jgi:glycine dehydrogenase subunit 1